MLFICLIYPFQQNLTLKNIIKVYHLYKLTHHINPNLFFWHEISRAFLSEPSLIVYLSNSKIVYADSIDFAKTISQKKRRLKIKNGQHSNVLAFGQ